MGTENVNTISRQDFGQELAPYAQDVLGRAQYLTGFDTAGNRNVPYKKYTGERIAQFDPLQTQAFDAARDLGKNQYTRDSATGIADLAKRAGNLYYNGSQYQNPYQINTRSFTGEGTAGSYMSPYMQSVVGIQQREAQRAADVATTGRRGEQTRAGAFGGSRAAIMDAEAARNLATQQGDIQAQGLQSAYQQAQQQFNAEQGRELTSAQYDAQYGQAANQLNEQSKQYGAGYGLQGLQAGMTGYGNLSNVGNTLYGQDTGAINMQNQFGTQRQNNATGILQNEYGDFQAAQNDPYKQVSFYSDIVRGLPATASSNTMSSSPTPSMLSQVGGLGATALGAYGAGGGFKSAANGGMVGRYAKGGLVRSRPQGLVALAIHSMA